MQLFAILAETVICVRFARSFVLEFIDSNNRKSYVVLQIPQALRRCAAITTSTNWAAAGFMDTLLSWKMKLDVGYGNEKAAGPVLAPHRRLVDARQHEPRYRIDS